jgi:hypothetical protein
MRFGVECIRNSWVDVELQLRAHGGSYFWFFERLTKVAPEVIVRDGHGGRLDVWLIFLSFCARLSGHSLLSLGLCGLLCSRFRSH